MYEVQPYFNNTLLPATRAHSEGWVPTKPVSKLLFGGYDPGDELIKSVATVTHYNEATMGRYTEDEEYLRACEAAFGVLNRDDRTNTDERSLSVGDVVEITGQSGVRWFACRDIGFERIEAPE